MRISQSLVWRIRILSDAKTFPIYSGWENAMELWDEYNEAGEKLGFDLIRGKEIP